METIVWTTIEYGCGCKVTVAKTEDLQPASFYLGMPCGKCQLLAENLAFLDEWEKHQEWLAQQPMQPEYDHKCDTCNVAGCPADNMTICVR